MVVLWSGRAVRVERMVQVVWLRVQSRWAIRDICDSLCCLPIGGQLVGLCGTWLVTVACGYAQWA